MLACKALGDSCNTEDNSTDNKQVVPDNKHYNHTLIEKCVSLFRKTRSHCNVVDFDIKYIKDERMKDIMVKMHKPEVCMLLLSTCDFLKYSILKHSIVQIIYCLFVFLHKK